jgi:hypothetical protein
MRTRISLLSLARPAAAAALMLVAADSGLLPSGSFAREPGAAPAIPSDEFARLHKLIKPQPGESKWATIPWLTSLPEARARAVKEDRPLFVWRAGGGEVLGRA